MDFNRIDWDIRKAVQERAWEDGYFSGRDGDPRDVPSQFERQSRQWLIGFDAAVEDKEKRKASESASS